MQTLLRLTQITYLTATLLGLIYLLSACGGQQEPEEVVIGEEPTEGLETTVVEVRENYYLIEEEVPMGQPEDSRIIAKHLDGSIDTIGLEEARLIAQDTDSQTKESRAVRSGYSGFFYYMMVGRMLGGRSPSAGAYSSRAGYNRSKQSGTALRQSARRITAPSTRTRTGYGSGRSSRSYGG